MKRMFNFLSVLIILLTLAFALPVIAAPDAKVVVTSTVDPVTQPVEPATKVSGAPGASIGLVPGAVEGKDDKKVPAAPEESQKWWQGLLVTVIEASVAILLPILSILLMGLIRKWNLKIDQDKVDWVLNKAIGYAEQKAKVALNEGEPMEGPEIARIAIDQAEFLLKKYKAAAKLGDWIAKGIEAKLGEKLLENGGKSVKPVNEATEG